MKHRPRFGIASKISLAILGLVFLLSTGASAVVFGVYKNDSVHSYRQSGQAMTSSMAASFCDVFDIEEKLLGDPLSTFMNLYFRYAPTDEEGQVIPIEDLDDGVRKDYFSKFNYLEAQALYKGYVATLNNLSNRSSAASVYVCVTDTLRQQLVFFAHGSSENEGYPCGYYTPCPRIIVDNANGESKDDNDLDWVERNDFHSGKSFMVLNKIYVGDNERGMAVCEFDESKLLGEAWAFSGITFSVSFGIGLFLWVVVFVLLNSQIIRPIVALSRKSEKMADSLMLGKRVEDFDLAIPKGHNEVVELYSSFKYLADSLSNYAEDLSLATAKEERSKAELDIAGKIQMDMLKPPFFYYRGCSLCCFLGQAKEIGGDFYDYFILPSGEIVFLVADVSGKGIPAAIMMAKVMEMIKGKALQNPDVTHLFHEVNESLLSENPDGLFATSFLAILNPRNGLLKYASAGHEPVFIVDDNGARVLSCPANFVLGGVSGMTYESSQVQLKKGDRIFLYTDGLSEAISESGELYGKKRIEEGLSMEMDSSAEAILSNMRQRASEFVGEAPQSDDLTMLCFAYEGEKSLTLKTNDESLLNLQAEMEGALMGAAASLKTVSEVSIIIDELFSNIRKYAYGGEEGELTFSYALMGGELYMSFADEGDPFNPLLAKSNLSLEEEGGLGIHIVKQIASSYNYSRINGENIFCLRKRLIDK